MTVITEVTAPARTVAPDEVLFEESLTETPIEAQILENAADILENEGWTRGNFAVYGNRCAVGGIGAAVKRMTFDHGEKKRARRAAEKALADLIREGEGDSYGWSDANAIVGWNDADERKREQVIRKFREAAARITGKTVES